VVPAEVESEKRIADGRLGLTVKEVSGIAMAASSLIYVTHCSARKNDLLEDSRRKVFPWILYTTTPTQRFMEQCSERGVRWAIFSDYHGIWFCDVRREWYRNDMGDPNRVTTSAKEPNASNPFTDRSSPRWRP
jgi:hypothetical protein